MTAGPRGATDLALFDFDHTITDADSFGRFIRDLATPQQLAAAKWTAGPWLAGYRLGLVSARQLRARVLKLARGAGEREARWAHLLCGDVVLPAATANAVDEGVSMGELAALRAEQTRLAAEVADLRALVQRLARELGVE